jgi:hypothetical protein
MGTKVNTTGKIARAGVKLRANRAVSVLVPETPAASQNDVLDEVPTDDIADSNQDLENKMEQPQQKEDSTALAGKEAVSSHKAEEVQLDDTVESEIGKAAGTSQGDATGSGKGPASNRSEIPLVAMELVGFPTAVEVSSQKAIQEDLLDTVESEVEKAAGLSKKTTAGTENDEAAKASEVEAATKEFGALPDAAVAVSALTAKQAALDDTVFSKIGNAADWGIKRKSSRCGTHSSGEGLRSRSSSARSRCGITRNSSRL